MNDSMAQAEGEAGPQALPHWKNWVGGFAAVALAIAFLVAGLWKITDPVAAAVRLNQAKVPGEVSLVAAVLLGISETFAGALLLVPRFRRWGAWLAGVLLIGFIVYIGAFYEVLRGEECNCFPWLKRAVGPAFFAGDAVMLALAALAAWWSRRPSGKRSAAVVLGAVTVFALVSYGVTVVRQSGVTAPVTIEAAGGEVSLHEGRVFLFFFDPECLHCDQVARELAKLAWGETRVIGVVVTQPQFGVDFMRDTGLPGLLSTDVERLRTTFSFVDVPYAVALEHGQQRASFVHFDGDGTRELLRRLGFVR